MAQQKKIPPVKLARKTPPGAHISGDQELTREQILAERRSPEYGKPVKKVPVQKQPPQVHIESKMRRYADVPAFGFDILEVTINGVKVEIYRACSFADNGGIPVMILPTHNGYACMSEAEADAYKEKIVAQALKPQLVTPGHPDFKKPPILH